MNDSTRRAAEAALGYTFRSADLLERAFRHASVVESRLDSNERLEFLGDAVLGLVVCQRIFERFPNLLEGEMTKIKSLAVSRQTCTGLARQLGLPEMLVLGKGMQSGDSLPPSLAAAVLESVIAAIYLDGGLAAAANFIVPLVDPLLTQAAASGHQQNFKSVLQQHGQQALGDTPVYRILDEKGPDHAKCFKVCVDLGGRRFTPSWGQSKKRAEQLAALNALRELGIVVEGEDGAMRVAANGAAALYSDSNTDSNADSNADSHGEAGSGDNGHTDPNLPPQRP